MEERGGRSDVIESRNLSPATSSATKLFPRSEHDVVHLGNKIYCFGGGRNERTNDLWILDLGKVPLC